MVRLHSLSAFDSCNIVRLLVKLASSNYVRHNYYLQVYDEYPVRGLFLFVLPF